MKRLGERADLARLRRRADAVGRTVRVVSGDDDKASVLAAFADQLELPAWFGRNFDALIDALRELPDPSGAGVELVWAPDPALAASHRETFDTMLELLAGVEAERPDLAVTVVGAR